MGAASSSERPSVPADVARARPRSSRSPRGERQPSSSAAATPARSRRPTPVGSEGQALLTVKLAKLVSPRPRHRTTAQEAADRLGRVAPLASRWIERVLAENQPPLTPAQYLALHAIATTETAGSELARQAGVSPAAVSQLLAGLEGAGLVERLRAAGDRRRQPLALSAAGERALHEARRLIRERLGALLDDLPGPELDALGRGLARLEELLSGRAPPRRPHRPPPPPPR